MTRFLDADAKMVLAKRLRCVERAEAFVYARENGSTLNPGGAVSSLRFLGNEEKQKVAAHAHQAAVNNFPRTSVVVAHKNTLPTSGRARMVRFSTPIGCFGGGFQQVSADPSSEQDPPSVSAAPHPSSEDRSSSDASSGFLELVLQNAAHF